MRWRTKEERLRIVLAAREALEKEPFTRKRIAGCWGVSAPTLGRWLRAYEKHGEVGLESGKPTGRPRRKV